MDDMINNNNIKKVEVLITTTQYDEYVVFLKEIETCIASWMESSCEHTYDQSIAFRLGVSTKAYRKAARSCGATLKRTVLGQHDLAVTRMTFDSADKVKIFIADFIEPKMMAMRMVNQA